jgi:hypothetical protein
MKKEIAFLIYLYEKEIEHLDESEDIFAALVSEIREKYAKDFGINYESE